MSSILQHMFPPVVANASFGNADFVEQNTKVKESIAGSPCLGLCGVPRILLQGFSPSENTALLFQCAVSLAMRGVTVMFVTHQKFTTLPVAVDGGPRPDPILMKQILIKYFSDRHSLLKELARIHTANPSPEAIIIDSLDFYTTNPKTSHVGQVTAALCAHLVDAVSFINERREKSKADSSSSITPPFVMASVTTSSSSRDSSPLYQDIYKKFLTTVFSITDVNGSSSMRQLQCWSGTEDLPRYVITLEIGETIKVVDIMKGSELEGNWSQMSSQVT